MLYDHITISCQEIIRSHYQMKAQGHQASFHATPGSPKGKHSAPSTKSAHKSDKKICNSKKKTGPRERLQEILRWNVACGRRLHFLLKYSSKYLLENWFSVMLSNIWKTGISELWEILVRKLWAVLGVLLVVAVCQNIPSELRNQAKCWTPFFLDLQIIFPPLAR